MFNPFAWLKIPTVEAHCDIPCGIYDPVSAKIAAQTVQKMVLRIQNLEHPAPGADMSAHQAFANTFGRYVTVKEEHRKYVRMSYVYCGLIMLGLTCQMDLICMVVLIKP